MRIGAALGRFWIGLFLPCLSHADPLDQWTRRYPAFQPGSLCAVAYGNNLFVAVGESISTSGDGYHWTNRAGPFPYLCGVAYAAGRYIAVGSSGTILTSSNAVQWTSVASPTTNNLGAVSAYSQSGGSQYAAVGERGTWISSNDGTNWVNQPTGLTNKLNSITSCSGSFVAVGDGGVLLYEPGFLVDTGWTNNFRAVACNNNVLTIGGDVGAFNGGQPQSSILYATDFFTFQAQTLNSSFSINGMAFGGDQFVAVGDTGHTLEYFYPGPILTSATGTNWVGTSAYSSESYLYGVTYGNGLFVAVGAGGTIVVSPNGTNWTQVTGYNRSAIVAMATAGDLCIASGQHIWVPFPYTSFPDFACLVSSNGTDWVVSSTNLPGMEELASSQGLFVGVNGKCAYTTTDGFAWSSNCISSNVLHGITWAKDRFVSVGENTTILTSPDGLNWTNRFFANIGPLFSAAYGNGLFVAGGAAIAISADGDFWSVIITNPPLNLRRILFANGSFVGIASAGGLEFPTNYFLTSSSDGVNWQIRSTVGAAFRGLAYQNGEYLSIVNSTPLKSRDGLNWVPGSTLLPLGSYLSIYYVLPKPLPSVCAYKGTFLVGGMDGTLMQSADTRVPILVGSPQIGSSSFNFSFNAAAGVPYRVQATSNLLTWQDAYSGVGTNLPTSYTDSTVSNTALRFFRVVSP